MNAWQRIAEVCRSEYGRFRAALAHPEAAQWARLNATLTANADSAFGRRHGFARLHSAHDYRRAVPLQSYAALAPEIERMALGEPGRLVCAPPVAFEQTSGSGGPAKLVPFTAAGLAAFRRAIEPWLFDLLASHPRIAAGRAYWAISPVGPHRPPTRGGTPVGIDDETGYLGPDLATHFIELLAAPLALGRIDDVEVWRYGLLRCLLDADDLSYISVWSPTFLLPLFESMYREGDRLARDLEQGTISWPTRDRSPLPGLVFDPRPERAAVLRRALSAPGLDATLLWPMLDTVSCWTHAGAAQFIAELTEHLPAVRIQGKGLLATEAAVSVPLGCVEYPVLAVNSAFFEFLDERAESWLAHELEIGGLYRVVVTTDSGLYRYDLGDRVRVRGFAGRTPQLEFTGRAGLVSDLCGEKLTEDLAAQSLAGVEGFAMIAPRPLPARGYVVVLDADRSDEEAAESLARDIEERLLASPQYAYARRLGQLAPLGAVRVRRPLAGWIRRGLRRGGRLGDVKPVALSSSADWADQLESVESAGGCVA